MVVVPAVIALAARLGVAGALALAGAGHAWDPSGFAVAIERYRLLPGALVPAAALYLPWLELIVGMRLACTSRAQGAMAVAVALLGTYLAALLSAAARGLDIACGCFRGGEDAGLAWPIARVLALLAALAVCWFAARRGVALGAPPVVRQRTSLHVPRGIHP
ncbi:MAG TPA: MauE/DoxX family redox-associated membrane protein [Planctomycetota bacterium]|nr:MauE/DoxX family redox-associated membrane protein [Planctomycetota bacterium]